MKINVKDLREALALLKPAVPRKTALPVLRNVLLHDGQATAMDLTTLMTVDLAGAAEPCLLPHRPALDFLKNLPGDRTCELTGLEKQVKVSCPGHEATFEYSGGVLEDYPPVPIVAGDECRLDGDRLVAALMEVLPCVPALDDGRPILTGICLTLGPEVKVAGADGFRLATKTVQKLRWNKDKKPIQAIIPADSVRALKDLWKKRPALPDLAGVGSPAEVALAPRSLVLTLDPDGSKAHFRLGRASLVSYLISGTYPNYETIIPDARKMAWVKADAPELLRAVQSVAGVAREASGIIRLEWQGDELIVSANGGDAVGSGRAVVPATSTEPGRIAFNVTYLTEYLAKKEGVVTLYTTTPSSSARWEHDGSGLYLLMPMFVSWGGESPKEEDPSELAPPDEGQTAVVEEAERVIGAREG